MAEDTALIAKRWFEEVWGERRRETIDELLAPSVVSHSPSGEMGMEAFRDMHSQILASMPDHQIEIQDLIAEGDRAVVRWRVWGSHSGESFGPLPAKGTAVDFVGTSWMRIENGLIVEGWDCWDQGGLMAKLAGL